MNRTPGAQRDRNHRRESKKFPHGLLLISEVGEIDAN